jgi:ABC-type multidrug transport system permease subunit
MNDKSRQSIEPVAQDEVTKHETPTIEAIPYPSTKGFNRQRHHGRLFWAEISWRIAGSLIFSIVLVAMLYTFSQRGNLSRWEKRWFNTLAILFSSLVSLSLGSLLGLLGNMLRWPLLAHKVHKPMDVRPRKI